MRIRPVKVLSYRQTFPARGGVQASPKHLPKGVCILPNGEHVVRRGRYFPTLENMAAIVWGHIKYYLPFYQFEARFREKLFQFNSRRLGYTAGQIKNHDIFEIYPDRDGKHIAAGLREVPVTQLVVAGDGPGEPDMSGNLMISPVKKVFEAAHKANTRVFLIGGGDNVYPVMSLKNAKSSLGRPISHIPHQNDFMFFCGNHEAWGDIYGVFQNPEIHAMMGQPPHLYYSLVFEHLNTRVICLDSGAKGKVLDERQIAWFERQLREAKRLDQEPLVMLHHPPILNGIETHTPMWKTLEPLLVEHRVTKLIGFHEHNYQRYQKSYALENGKTHVIDFLVQGNFGAFTHATHHIGKKGLLKTLFGWIPVIKRIWNDERKITPLFLCPTPQESRDFFTWFRLPFLGWKVPIPSILEWWWSLRDKPPFFKGFTLVERPTPDHRLRLHHYVRSHYKEATCVVDEVLAPKAE